MEKTPRDYVCEARDVPGPRKAQEMAVMWVAPSENQGTKGFAGFFPRTHPQLLDKELTHITALSHISVRFLADEMATSVTRLDRKVP